MARSAGLALDMRTSYNETYSNYKFLDFNSYLGTSGDCYDRFLLRIQEMVESLNISNQVISNFNTINFNKNNINNLTVEKKFLKNNLTTQKIEFNKFNKKNKYNDMESLINHFKYYTEGFKVPEGFTYRAIEAPKGEFGVSLISDGSTNPYKCKVRTPALQHLQMLNSLCKGHMFADLVTLIGSLDVVFGEIDR